MERRCMMVGWFVECWFRCCQSREIVRRWWVETGSESDETAWMSGENVQPLHSLGGSEANVCWN
jgi:hypothetical protein